MNKKLLIYILLAATGLLSSLSNFQAISILLSIFFIYIILSYSFKSVESLLYRLVLALISYTVIFQIGAILSWLTNINLFALTYLVCVLLLAVILLRNSTKHKGSKLLSIDDLISIAVALSAIIFIFGLSIVRSGYTSAVLNTANTNHDDISHLSLIQSVHTENGVVYGTKDQTVSKILLPSLTAYPQGWHVSQLPFIKVIENLGIKMTPWNWQVVYCYLKLLWFALLVFMFTRIILVLSQNKYKENTAGIIIRFVAATIASATISILLFNNVFALGFFNFIGVLIYVLTSLVLIYDGLQSDVKKENFGISYVIGSALLISAATITWIISGAIIFVMLLIPIFFSANNMVTIIAWIKKQFVPILFAMAILTIGMVQVYVQMKFSIKTDALNEGGGINKIVGLIFLLFVLLACFSLSFKKSRKLIVTAQIGLALTLITSFLYYYQIIRLGEARYYAIKLSYIPFAVLGVVAGALFIVFLEKIRRQHGLLAGIIVALLPVAILPIAFDSSFGATKALISGSSQIQKDLSLAVRTQLESSEFKNNSYIVYLGRSSGEDQAATRILNLGTRYYGGCDNKFTGLLYNMPANKTYIAGAIAECRNSQRPVIYLLSENTITQISIEKNNSIVRL